MALSVGSFGSALGEFDQQLADLKGTPLPRLAWTAIG
jgi:hypothetical protein